MENFDIHRFLKIINNSKLYLIATLLLFITMGYFYSFYYVTPMYQSSATVVLVQNDSLDSEDTSITQKDITLNQNLLSTYTKIAKSDRILNQVIKNLNLNTSVEQLSQSINVKAVNNTEVFKISVSHQDATTAANITNELLTVFSNEVKNLYNMNNVYAIDTAEIATSPFNINHTKDLMLFTGIGFVIYFGIVMAIYLLDTTIKSEQDVEEYADLSVLSTIPMYRENYRTELIVNEQPKSPISECFKTFRTNIMFSIENKKLNTILVTSGDMGEGKSFVSSNLAVTFAESGKKVILVDTDMRKGRQHKIFGISVKHGLSNCLSAIGLQETPVNINEYIQETNIPNLHIMTSGDVPPNPSELLSSPNMKKFLEALNTQYDIVICDGTPCMLVSDSIILSKIVDTTVIVTANKVTKLDTLLKIKKSLQMVSANIGGVVINKMNVNTKAYQNQYYYGNHNEINKKIEYTVSQTTSLLEKPLFICDTPMEQEVEKSVINIEKNIANASLPDSNTELLKDMSEVKSQIEQIKDIYKTLMQSTLNTTFQKDTLSSNMMQEFNTVKDLYQTIMDKQNNQIQQLANKIETLNNTTDMNTILIELNHIKEFYENSVIAQNKEIAELGETISTIQESDISNRFTQEFSKINDFYENSILEQNAQIQTLAEQIEKLTSHTTSDTISNELNSIKESYENSIIMQKEQMELLKQKIDTLSERDSSDILQELLAMKKLYEDMLLSQSKEINTLSTKFNSLEITDHSDILLHEIDAMKENYQYEFDIQKEQLNILQQKIEDLSNSNDSNAFELELKQMQELYHTSMLKYLSQIETLETKIENLQTINNTTPLLQEMKEFYEISIQNQNEKMLTLSEKLSSLESTSNVDLVKEFSKLSRQLENMNQRFDFLEEKANHNEYLIHHLAKTNHQVAEKQEKLIDIKRLNAKVIQLQDYIEKQPIELPITSEISLSTSKAKTTRKSNTILEGQLNIMDTIEQPIISNIEKHQEKQSESQKHYVVDYEQVQNKQKKRFNFFKKNKSINEETEELISPISQILSGINTENVG